MKKLGRVVLLLLCLLGIGVSLFGFITSISNLLKTFKQSLDIYATIGSVIGILLAIALWIAVCIGLIVAFINVLEQVKKNIKQNEK